MFRCVRVGDARVDGNAAITVSKGMVWYTSLGLIVGAIVVIEGELMDEVS